MLLLTHQNCTCRAVKGNGVVLFTDIETDAYEKQRKYITRMLLLKRDCIACIIPKMAVSRGAFSSYTAAVVS